MIYNDFHDLGIWKNGYELLMKVYNLSDLFSEEEKFSLTSQIRRSANSIIANIAESHGRFSYADKVRVLYIVRGEICETMSHLAVAFGRKYINKDQFINLNLAYKQLAIDLNKYILNLKNK